MSEFLSCSEEQKKEMIRLIRTDAPKTNKGVFDEIADRLESMYITR